MPNTLKQQVLDDRRYWLQFENWLPGYVLRSYRMKSSALFVPENQEDHIRLPNVELNHKTVEMMFNAMKQAAGLVEA